MEHNQPALNIWPQTNEAKVFFFGQVV